MTFPEHWGNLRPAHIMFAREYLTAAEILREHDPNSSTAHFHSPSLLLLAHALELTLKAISLWLGKNESQLEQDRHSLLAPFNRAKSNPVSMPLIARAEKTVKEQWKMTLKGDRQDYLTRTQHLLEPESPSNYDIGQQLPTLQHAVEWMHSLHATKGSAFRYLQFGMVSVPVTAGFGKTRNVVPTSVSWGCKAILDSLDQELRASNCRRLES